MLIAKQILVSALVLGAGVLNLAGCGQTGNLYLPPPRPASAKPAGPAAAPAPATPATSPSEPRTP